MTITKPIADLMPKPALVRPRTFRVESVRLQVEKKLVELIYLSKDDRFEYGLIDTFTTALGFRAIIHMTVVQRSTLLKHCMMFKTNPEHYMDRYS